MRHHTSFSSPHEIIAARRTELAMTQTELARAIGLKHPNFISMVESQKSQFPLSRVLQFADATNPFGEFRLGVAAGEVRQLEVCVAVDEAGDQNGIGEMHGACGVRRRHSGVRAHRRDSSGSVHKNGAVLDGRRRYGEDSTSPNAKHERPLWRLVKAVEG